MENNYPKRRKYKDNPYTLEYKKESNTYKVNFKDSKGIYNSIEVNEIIYKAFNQFELKDISQMNEYERHIEHSEVYENTLNKRAVNLQKSVEDLVEEKLIIEKLKYAIDSLSDIQKRRIKKYYFEGKNEYDIAKEENTTQQAINKSLRQAITKMKEILKK